MTSAHPLKAFEGKWSGKTKTWFEPDKLADESPWRGTTRVLLDGRALLHEYEGAILGKPFTGSALFVVDAEKGKATCAWVDTFHMSRELLFSEGTATGGGLSVLGSYAAGEGPRWGWRTALAMDGGKLVITMFNRTPDGEEAKAVETVYARAKAAAAKKKPAPAKKKKAPPRRKAPGAESRAKRAHRR